MNKEYLYSPKSIKKALRFTNFFIIGLLSFLVLLMITYNVIILCARANVKDNDRITDYGKIGDTYLVQVKTDNWKSAYPQFSLLLVHEVDYDYEFLNDPANMDLLNKVYLIKTSDGKENFYTVAKIISKVHDEIVISGNKTISYNDLVGVVYDYIPIVAIFNYELFLFATLILIAIFVGLLLYFTSLDLGYDIIFEEQVSKELKKDALFGLKFRNKKGKNEMFTSEEIVENLLSNIISNKQKEEKTTPIASVVNAIKVIDAKDFSTKEKVFVYFASLNLLNKYVKEDNCNDNLKNNYYFKKFAASAVDELSSKREKPIVVYGDNKFCLVNCMGLEFSFHNIDVQKVYPSKEWSGLKLQPYANAIFQLFFEKEFKDVAFDVKDKTFKAILIELEK